MIPEEKVKNLISKHSKLESDLSSLKVDKKNLLRCQRSTQP